MIARTLADERATLTSLHAVQIYAPPLQYVIIKLLVHGRP